MNIKLYILTLILSFSLAGFSQGFLHVDGKKIVDGSGENFIIRSIGTGNWMLQEGYMMKSSSVAGTQHEFRAKLIESIGEERTNEFYNTWLANHFTKTDVDSMKAWGFNAVRVAMHYVWFTPPIEVEPVNGEITWINKGFEMMDDLLSWCASNQMYLILDLHGAPGGQGKDSGISDYDPSKPSLWESDLNKQKTVALWAKLAERYANEPWMGGYDLINEINWSFDDNNAQIRKLYGEITDAIRAVDQNHIIFIEGNWFANDFTGLTPAWDDNMVYSFHKYWSYNDATALKWMTDMRDQTNRPIWLGETGENSNTWFTNLVALSEKNNIGWSWWPVKKSGINNVLKVETNEDYTQLIMAWEKKTSLSPDDTYNAVMKFADNHKIENCEVAYDVIDALIRQPFSTETKPFKQLKTGEAIFASDYDLGRNNYAYYDLDTADYHLNTSKFQAWNIGWAYRSDGVDIDARDSDEITNGYCVGWTNPGEWMQYTIQSEKEGAYTFSIRTAAEQIGGAVHLEVNGKVATSTIELPKTGDWDTWKTTTFDHVILPAGTVKIKLAVDQNGSNINYFKLTDPTEIASVDFELLSASTDKIENVIYVNLNKKVTSTQVDKNDFQVIVNNRLLGIAELVFNENQIEIRVEQDLLSNDNIRISYKGNSVQSNQQGLVKFTGEQVSNNFYIHHAIPGRVEAEDFIANKGFDLEECKDEGGGLNTAYASDGDYLDYLILVDKSGSYKADFRIAAKSGNPEILIMKMQDDRFVVEKLFKVQATGDWQNWTTQSTEIKLSAGKQVLRIFSRKGEHNLNWMNFDFLTGIEDVSGGSDLKVFPNPTKDSLWVESQIPEEKTIIIYDLSGNKIATIKSDKSSIFIDTHMFSAGTYIVQVNRKGFEESRKIQIIK